MAYKFNPFTGTLDWTEITTAVNPPTLQVELPPGVTTVVDSFATSPLCSKEYVVAITKNTNVKNFKFNVSSSSSGPITQVYARSGDPISAQIDAVINGSNVEIRVHNSEIQSLWFLAVKIST
jgi:hypothetical protein